MPKSPPDASAPRLLSWMKEQGWKPLPHQLAMWQAISAGQSGLLQMPTGAGKTYAAYFGFLPKIDPNLNRTQLLYITPLRALSRDLEKALKLPCEALGLPIRIESRTGDTKASARARQKKKPPHVLVTTPESLALLLSYTDAKDLLSDLVGVVVDEWHELLGSKRGSLLELNLARLRRLNPGLPSWGLSATVQYSLEAASAIAGAEQDAQLIKAPFTREVAIETLLPAAEDRLPWAGHLGLRMLPALLRDLRDSQSCLIFTNTRSQAERWFEALQLSRPDFAEKIALHHGSIDAPSREAAEQGVKEGRIKWVVCTASLDLGVDFPEVDRVYQIGSPKQIARLIQRAGRSEHRPGGRSQLCFVPTHGLELLEIIACRQALAAGEIEARTPLPEPLDVLAQHILSMALSEPFEADELYDEVRHAWSFRLLTRAAFDWTLAFVHNGGGTLKAYPQYSRLQNVAGLWQIPDAKLARLHRQNLGTIVSDSSIAVKLGRGKKLGSIDESFIAKLKKGESFLFAGRWLELVTLQDLTAYVRLSRKKDGAVPTWSGQGFPWSPLLARHMRQVCGELAGDTDSLKGPERDALSAIIDAQRTISIWPAQDELLIEMVESREGQHVLVYPFESKQIHEGLALLITQRILARHRISCTTAANDYGFELLCSRALPLEEWQTILDWSALGTAPLDALPSEQLEKRQFRGIARVVGLVQQNYAGQRKSTRQVQSSSTLLYDVFARFDPGNLLLSQARREVLEQHFDGSRLRSCLERLQAARCRWQTLDSFSPLGFPLSWDRISVQLSSESAAEKLQRIKDQWQKKSQRSSVAKRSRSTRTKPSSGSLSAP